MNTWRDRLLIGFLLLLFQWAWNDVNAPLPNTREFALLLLFQWAWNDVNAPLPNTREFALLFFGGAATLEYLIFRVIPKVLDGPLCNDMMVLAYMCIALDALGFLGYMTKTPSIYYNTVMWGMSYVQWARLLFVDSNHAASFWNSLVRGFNSGRAKAHFKAKTR